MQQRFNQEVARRSRSLALASSAQRMFVAFLFLALTSSAWAASPSTPFTTTPIATLETHAPSHGPGAVFESVNAAVMDAMQFGRRLAPVRHGRIAAGTVFKVPGGYSYEAPRTSNRPIWASRSPSLRIRLGESDVATYLIRPGSGRAALDRLNSRLTDAERRYVKEVDSAHRPIFLLTPSREVVRYGEARPTAVVSLDGGVLPRL